MRQHSIMPLVLSVVASLGSVRSQLIPDGSFELGSLAGCSCPSTACGSCLSATLSNWYIPNTGYAGGYSTYSTNCVQAVGAALSCDTHFAGVSSAANGLRFVAAFGGPPGGGDGIGTQLSGPLVPGNLYSLSGQFLRSNNFAGINGYDVFLQNTSSVLPNAFVGTIGRTGSAGIWLSNSITFEAPTGASQLLLVARRTRLGTAYSYQGCDNIALSTAGSLKGFHGIAAGGRSSVGQWIPYLSGSGSTSANGQFVITCDYTPNSNATVLAIGTQKSAQVISGINLVTQPIIVAPMQSGGGFSAYLPFVWPASLPIGTVIYFQAWVADPGVPGGLAASNGIKAAT